MALTFLHRLARSFLYSRPSMIPPFLLSASSSASNVSTDLRLHLQSDALPRTFACAVSLPRSSSSAAFDCGLWEIQAFPASGARTVCLASDGSQERSVGERITVENDGGDVRDDAAKTQRINCGNRRRSMILYSKPGCCLCDELKQKLETVFLMGGDMDLSDVILEVRDITTNPEWERAFQYEIPVLARVKEDSSEELLPRLSPRLGFEQLQKKLFAALS